ncbi:MAG TPA: sensor histidine kinase [Leifsonia sp.]|jgi:signal transduction histidine kinase
MPWNTDDAAAVPPHGRDGWAGRRPPGARWFPVIFSALVQIPGIFIALHARDPLTLLFVLIAFASSFVLLAGRTHPGPVVAVVGALCAPAIAITIGPPLAVVPLAIAVVGAVVRGARIWAWWTLAAFAVLGPLAAFVLLGSPIAIIRPLIVALVLCLLVGVGEAIRNRRERYREISRTVKARRDAAAEAERLRIARELHDVLAHSLSQISVQAGVGLHLFDSRPEKARESLEAIKTTSSQALEEVRGVLGFLRAEGYPASRAPEPDLDRIPVLVETYRRAGLSVRYDRDLTSTPAPAIQLAIYRIVQESLTNVGRHAQARSVAIALHEEGSDYVVSVSDDGRGLPEGGAEPGRGLTGMQERAELLGGRFEARPGEHGGLTVVARIPIRTVAGEAKAEERS